MRLTRITTRSGDDGTTGLGDGSRVGKDSARIAAIGEVDALNCAIGVVLAQPLPPSIAADVASRLEAIQSDLFSLGGELAAPGYDLLDTDRVAALDAIVGEWNARLPPLAEFILPQGTAAAAHAHLARTACRRTERLVVRLASAEAVRPAVLQYLNRLSDLLFVVARLLNREAGVADRLWVRQAGA